MTAPDGYVIVPIEVLNRLLLALDATCLVALKNARCVSALASERVMPSVIRHQIFREAQASITQLEHTQIAMRVALENVLRQVTAQAAPCGSVM